MPVYTPLDDPAPADPADQTLFEVFTAANLPDIESGLDAAGNELATAGAGMDAAAAVLDTMGTDLAAAFAELEANAAEEDAITLADELAAAAEQDSELGSLADDVLAGLAALPPDIFLMLFNAIFSPLLSVIEADVISATEQLQLEIDQIQTDLASTGWV